MADPLVEESGNTIESFQIEPPPARKSRKSRRSIAATLVIDQHEEATAVGDDWHGMDLDLPGGTDGGERVSLGASMRDSIASSSASVRKSIVDLRKSTLLDQNYIEQLEREEPETVSYLQSSAGLIMQFGLLFIFVGLDVGKSIMNGVALKGTGVVTQSMVIVQGLVQVVVGLGVAFAVEGREGVEAAVSFKAMAQFGAVSVFFALAQTFNVLSYTILEPGMIKILGQVRLLQTAVLSVLILGRRYIQTQWMLLILTVLSAVNFFMGKLDNQEIRNQMKIAGDYLSDREQCHGALQSFLNGTSGSFSIPDSCKTDAEEDPIAAEESRMLIGIGFVFMYLILSDMGSIVSEKFFKQAGKTPFYQQKATQELVSLPISLLMSFIVPFLQEAVGVDKKRWERQMWWTGESSFFINWSMVVLGAVLVSTLHSFLSGLVVKKLSSVTKLLGKCASVALVYFVGDCWLTPIMKGIENPPPAPKVCTVSAVMVMLSTFTFLGVKAPPKEEPKAEARAPVLAASKAPQAVPVEPGPL